MKARYQILVLLLFTSFQSFAQTTLTEDANGVLNTAKVVAVTSAGQSFFIGHQAGAGYANSFAIFSALTDNPNGASNIFYDGQVNGVTNFSVRADGQGYFAGSVGIGTANPLGKLHVSGAAQATDFSTAALNLEQPYTDFGSQNLVGASTMYRTNNGSSYWALGGIAGVIGTQGNTNGFPGGLAFYTKAADGNPSGIPVEQMRIAPNGNLLIGKSSQTNTTYRVDVNGAVRANAVTVNTTGADFVFKTSYKLRSLPALKQYITENHHLPEMASAKEMQTNGLDVGENEVKLLQKVEELTLYLIEKDKENKAQQAELKSIKNQLTRLNKQFHSFTKTSKKPK